MSDRRVLHVGLLFAVTAAAVGLIAGLRGTSRTLPMLVAGGAAREASAPANESRSYADMRERMTGANGEVQKAWWSGTSAPNLFAEVAHSDDDRRKSLAQRAERRAYEGAPPSIPHAVDQMAAPACLTCHDRGRSVAGLIAPAMSHEPLANCLQCHAAEGSVHAGAPSVAAIASTFVGLPAPAKGERAWPGAPPTIPHSTRMRERCDACHGMWGSAGMKTTHPWRQVCQQCHAPSAELDRFVSDAPQVFP